jgi:hypothetical protein
MKIRLLCRLLVAAGLPAFTQACHPQSLSSPPAHVISRFHFTVDAPFARVAPQFGPEAERAWGDPQWNPQFIYPQPGKDTAGAVFTVPYGKTNSIWINTNYDPVGGRMQYVYLVGDVMVCVIDVHVTSTDSTHTVVDVTYTRTALTSEHNDGVGRLAMKDAQNGPVWKQYVEHALGMANP